MRTIQPGDTHSARMKTHSYDKALPPGEQLNPRRQPPQDTLSLKPLDGGNRAPKATVLSVEDNDDLRRLMQITLDIMGFYVISRPDAESASAAYRACSAIDLLVTDLEMPGRSGLELARELCAVRPALPVLIVSGAHFSSELQQAVRQNNWRFLPKPFNIPALSAMIQNLIGSPAPARGTLPQARQRVSDSAVLPSAL